MNSISLCLNASPLQHFIATDFDINKSVDFLRYPSDPSTSTNKTTTTSLDNEQLNNQSAVFDERLKYDVFTEVPAGVTIMPRQNLLPNKNQLFFNRSSTYEDYRQGVKSWLTWQDSFILPNFILLALLSIGAIAAFKV